MVTEVTKRTMRTCRYKTIEANITGLVDSYNVQYLLAICKVDFNHYTEISIENQNETPEALQEFFKVMRKDTTQGIRAREKVSKEHLPKYDSLLLQYLMHEEILERVLKFNVLKADDFNWQNELRFGWDDSGTDEPNIIVRQLHIGVKYGSKFVGSKAKPIQECSLSFLTSVKFNELALITGSSYAF